MMTLKLVEVKLLRSSITTHWWVPYVHQDAGSQVEQVL